MDGRSLLRPDQPNPQLSSAPLCSCRNNFSLLHFQNFKLSGIDMQQQKIGLIAAMPEEIKPFLKLIGTYAKSAVAGFNVYCFDIDGKSCRLIESGMGISRAAKATEALIAVERPAHIISFGFGGAVHPGMVVGDLAIAGSSRLYQGSPHGAIEAITLAVPDTVQLGLQAICKKLGHSAWQSDFLTSGQILNKKQLAEALRQQDAVNPVLDMETWAIARVTARERIPLLAIRAISDAAEEELGFNINEFTDNEMNIRMYKILGTIARKPWIIPQLLRLAGNSRIAGRNLAAAVKELLENSAKSS
jgi:adenosylhomocysteine nucleosidase